MLEDIRVLLDNLPLILLFFLPVSSAMGGIAASYAVLLERMKNRLVSYAIPFIVIIIMSLFMAFRETSGPILLIVNIGDMLLYYPMVVVLPLPLANYFVKLEKTWVLALIVGTSVMLVMLTLGGLKGDQIAVIPDVPPTYVDNLVLVAISFISTLGYVIAGYFIVIAMTAILNKIKKDH